MPKYQLFEFYFQITIVILYPDKKYLSITNQFDVWSSNRTGKGLIKRKGLMYETEHKNLLP
jgi:hypothetical protein